MLGVNIPGAEDREALRRDIWAAGHRYIERLGWAVFLEKRGTDGKIYSLKMCEECENVPHDRATCPHRRCHGFYAGTNDPETWDALWAGNPDGDVLAVRTGAASGIFVVDFDLKHGAPEAHDRWAEIVGTPGTEDQPGRPGWTFSPTLKQRTKSGGFHLVYRYPHDGEGIRSRNAVTLPGIDVKGDGGLFVVDPTPGYAWHERVLPQDASAEVTTWARTAPVHRSADRRRSMSRLAERIRSGDGGRASSGVSLKDASLGGCPVGDRDWFVNAVAHRLRVEDTPWDEAVSIMREEYERMESPEGDEWQWRWCMYKLTRAWRDIAPNPTVAAGARWVRAAAQPSQPSAGQVQQLGKITIVGRGL